jgi:hypothetical protein
MKQDLRGFGRNNLHTKSQFETGFFYKTTHSNLEQTSNNYFGVFQEFSNYFHVPKDLYISNAKNIAQKD